MGLNHWDHAAGALIAREAGAIVTGASADTEPSERFTLAASPAIWADLAEILAAADAANV